MSIDSRVSLIDLSKQFPFDIDDKIKQAICFGETLLVSCGHYEGEEVEEGSDSEWSCHSTASEHSIKEAKEEHKHEITLKEKDEEQVVEEEAPEDVVNDFHLYFFPDCKKAPPPTNSKASILVGPDGMPRVNPVAQGIQFCECGVDIKTGKCTCFTKLPCKCGAKTRMECTCAKLETICTCEAGKLKTVCTCKESEVCVCQPGDKPERICTCEDIEKPCLCHPGKFPTPVCTCIEKPTFIFEDTKKTSEVGEEESESESNEMNKISEVLKIEKEHIPCTCTKPEPKERCRCLKDEECICKTNACICGVRRSCLCLPGEEGEEIICKDQDDKSICSCKVPEVCHCGNEDTIACECFPEPTCCTCGDPENCKCFTTCECPDPCLCDMVPKEEECVCAFKDTPECTCLIKADEGLKLKKTRAGKHGFRWCHDVDPRHTYFDYAYERHDKISYKEQFKEKLKILGLHEEAHETEQCEVHGVKPPPYKKKVRKQSIDCCSTVGGMSISVECLGEDKDKFLVQVVSHSAKEGAKAGTKLVSILDMHLHTMEENRSEHITKKDLTKECRSYMAICEKGYYNKVTRICGEKDVVKRFYHSFKDAHNFLLEGANVVLLRYFGISRYRGIIRTETVLIDGVICESIYVCLGVSQAIVNGKPLFVCKVERHIIEPSGVLHQTLSVLTLRGYLVSHEWAHNSYIIHINPLLNIIPEKDLIEPHVPLRQNWREDLQLLSDYLDFKTARTSEGGKYVSENGTLTSVVRDYLQALLMLRPQDGLHFTRHYFGSVLSALDLPHDEYFDPCNKHVRYFFFED